MKRWEYRIVDSRDVPGGGWFKEKDRVALESYLDRLGAEGWEVVNVDTLELEGRTSFFGIAKRERGAETS